MKHWKLESFMEFGVRLDLHDKIFILAGFVLLIFAYTADGTAIFTASPPNILYISNGGTAKLTWEYTVTNRTTKFKAQSPTWNFYLANGSTTELAYHNNENKIWNLSNSCPARLRGRLKIDLPATLIISKVTTSDNGTYGCTLRLSSGGLVTSKAQLFITVRPTLSIMPPSNVVVFEGQVLRITCSAAGYPVPTVTWKSLNGDAKSGEEKGSAVLRIQNIRREESGKFECQATNNPNEEPVTAQVTVTVQYRPSIDSTLSTHFVVSAWGGHVVHLRCFVNGNPSPQIFWYSPNGQRIVHGVSTLEGGSLLTLITKEEQDYGKYVCRASNSRGYDYRSFKVNRIYASGPLVMLAAKSVEATLVVLSWRRPADDGGSPIIDYRTHINTNPPREISVKGTSLVIAALVENTKYLVNMSARNVVGYGNSTSMFVTTKKVSPTSTSNSTAALAVCLPIIFILMLVIVAVLFYIIWKRRKRKGNKHARANSKPDIKRHGNGEVNTMDECSKHNGIDLTAESDDNRVSCFQPFAKRSRRPRTRKKRPLHILDPIKEECSDEDTPETIQGTELRDIEVITEDIGNEEPIPDESNADSVA